MEEGGFEKELLNAIVGFGEFLNEFLFGVFSVSGERLLVGVVEELFDEGFLRSFGADCEVGDVLWGGDADGAAVVVGVLASGVDGLIVIAFAPAADGIVLLEGEAEWVDFRVAAHAGGGACGFRHFFTHGPGGIEVGVLELHGFRRGFEGATHDASGEKDAAVDGRGVFEISEGGEQVGMGEEAGALAAFEMDFFEIVADGFRLVKFRKAVVEHHVVRAEELAVVGAAIPDNIINEETERTAEVGENGFIEIRVFLRIFRDVVDILHLEPMVEKPVELFFGPRIAKHTIGLFADVFLGVQPAVRGVVREISVRDGIPEREGEAGSDGELVRLFAFKDVRVEELGRG